MNIRKRSINAFRPICRDAIAVALFFLLAACSMPNDGKILDDSIIPETSVSKPTGINLSTLAPGDLTAVLNANGVQLDWRSFVSGFGPNTYSIYRSISGANDFQLLGSTIYNTNQYAPFSQRFLSTNYQDSNVTGGVAYDYYVTLLENNGTLRKSKVVKVTPISPFRLLSAVQDQSYNVTFTWETAGGAASYKLVAGTAFQNYPIEYSDSTSPTTISGLATGRTFFAVKATSTDGPYIYTYNTFSGNITGNFTASMDYSVNGKLLLKWTASSDASNFKVVYGTSPGVYNQIYSLSATSPLEINGLTPLNTYYFRVISEGGLITHESANEVSFVYQIPITQAWTFSSSSQYTYNPGIDFLTGTSCKLTPADHIDNDGSATGFGGGSVNGLSVSSLTDGSTGLKLGFDGTCNGANTNCNEMDSGWAPRWSNLQAYWKLNEGVGLLSAADSSGNNNTLTASAVTFGSAGHHQGSATMNGTTSNLQAQSVTVGNFERTQPFTVSAWIMRNTTGVQHIIAGTNSTGSPNPGWSLQAFSDNWIYFSITGDSGAGNYLQIRGNYGIYNNRWYHVVATYDGSSTAAGMKIYVNGILNSPTVTSNTLSMTTVSTNPLRIGTYPGLTGYFNGKIDEFAIWDTALTATEVAAIYQRQEANYGGRFISRIMDAGAGNTAGIWSSLSWLSTQPFGKELPDYNASIQNETTTEYSSILTTSLMNEIRGLWHMNQTSGLISDTSGSGAHGTVVGGVTYNQPGKFNRSLHFNGSNAYLNAGTSNQLNITGPLTVSAWARRASGWRNDMIFRRYGGTAPNPGYGIYINASNQVCGWIGTGGWLCSASNTVIDNSWHFYTYVWDGSVRRIYLDGQQVAVDASPVAANLNAPGETVFIGANSGTTWQFLGWIDEVAVWNRQLSIPEIQHLYMRGASRVKFQVRSCSTSNCAGTPFQGPDGTLNTFFSEWYNRSVQSVAPAGLALPTSASMNFGNFTSPPSVNRYFQYQAILESDLTSATLVPELKSVTVAPAHYSNSSPVVVGTTGMQFNTITSLAETLGAEGCSSGVTYNLGIGTTSPDTWYWWDATANSGSGGWVVSNGTQAQSNSLSVINSHISLFHTQAGTGVLYVKSFLNSTGATACELTNLQASGFIY